MIRIQPAIIRGISNWCNVDSDGIFESGETRWSREFSLLQCMIEWWARILHVQCHV